jgi:hypothetical protein
MYEAFAVERPRLSVLCVCVGGWVGVWVYHRHLLSLPYTGMLG